VLHIITNLYIEACRKTHPDIHCTYVGKKEIHYIFKIRFIISVLFSTK